MRSVGLQVAVRVIMPEMLDDLEFDAVKTSEAWDEDASFNGNFCLPVSFL